MKLSFSLNPSWLISSPERHLLNCMPSMLKSLYNKLRVTLACYVLADNYKKVLDAKLERKMMEIKTKSAGNENFKTIDTIIMKFPQFRDGFKEIRLVFEHYDEDSNGTIDKAAQRRCLHELKFCLEDEEIDDLFHYCDMDQSKGIQFDEFIVLLCLAYLLTESTTSSDAMMLNTNWQKIQPTFDAIVRVFLFLDKTGEGQLRRKDVVRALNEASPKEKSPSHITRNRFREMDWDRNGKVSFKEFLYSFIRWVGVNDDSESPE